MDTKEAFDKLKLAMQSDYGYAWTWHANIAMSIYDESRPNCMCEILDGTPFKGHRPNCSVVRAKTAGAPLPLSHEFCNHAAARFMKLCFDVDTSKEPTAADFRLKQQ